MKKTIKEPTIAEMKEFCSQFPKHVWADLCYKREFVEAVSTDLKKAEKIAKEYSK